MIAAPQLVSAALMNALDRSATKDFGIKGIVLMENAGRGVFELLLRELQCRCENKAPSVAIVVIAGKGNNGGDGLVVARYLKNAGIEVDVFLLANLKDVKGDAKTNLNAWQKMGGKVRRVVGAKDIKTLGASIRRADLIVDAIFGTGFSGEVSGIHKKTIELINKQSGTVVSIDVPSGINATTGAVLGTVVRADITATMAIAKSGLYLSPASQYVGCIEVIDIGMPRELLDDLGTGLALISEEAARAIVSKIFPRKSESHKGTHGHLLVIGGSIGKTGAAYLASVSANAAMRAGAGLVTCAVPESLNAVMEAKTTEVMTHPLSEGGKGSLGESSVKDALRALKNKDALVIGPGLGTAVGVDFFEKLFARCRGKKIPVVIDADGLNVFEKNLPSLVKALKGVRCVLTPHAGEMARLLGVSVKAVQAKRLELAKKLSAKTKAVVVLKGAGTIVATPLDGAFINSSGNPALASAGTGDVLSGIIGGFLAEGLSTDDAALAGVFIHGACADYIAKDLGEAGMIASDLIAAMPVVLNELV
jgi:NAD(P)H-hydrate epimerase